METKEQETHEFVPDVPQAQHEWLHRLLGDWTYEMAAPEGTNAAEKATGTESVRSLGGLWVILEGRGEMTPAGSVYSSQMSLGYDPKKERFVGFWIGSMMTHMWIYNGRLEGNVLSLESEGPDMSKPGGTRRYKDVVELVSDDHRTLTGNMMDDDGNWQPMMWVDYRRKR